MVHIETGNFWNSPHHRSGGNRCNSRRSPGASSRASSSPPSEQLQTIRFRAKESAPLDLWPADAQFLRWRVSQPRKNSSGVGALRSFSVCQRYCPNSSHAPTSFFTFKLFLNRAWMNPKTALPEELVRNSLSKTHNPDVIPIRGISWETCPAMLRVIPLCVLPTFLAQ